MDLVESQEAEGVVYLSTPRAAVVVEEHQAPAPPMEQEVSQSPQGAVHVPFEETPTVEAPVTVEAPPTTSTTVEAVDDSPMKDLVDDVSLVSRAVSADAVLSDKSLKRVQILRRGTSAEAGESRLTMERWQQIEGQFNEKQTSIKETITSKRTEMFNEIKHLRAKSIGADSITSMAGSTVEGMASSGRSVTPESSVKIYEEIKELRRGISVHEIKGVFDRPGKPTVNLDDWRRNQIELDLEYRRAINDARGRLFQINFFGNETSNTIRKLKYESNRLDKCEFIRQWAEDQRKRGLPVTSEGAERFLRDVGVINPITTPGGGRSQSMRLPSPVPGLDNSGGKDSNRPPVGWAASEEYHDWMAVVDEVVTQFLEENPEPLPKVEGEEEVAQEVVAPTEGGKFDWEATHSPDDFLKSQEVKPVDLETETVTDLVSSDGEGSPTSQGGLSALSKLPQEAEGKEPIKPRRCIPINILSKVKKYGFWVSKEYEGAVVKGKSRKVNRSEHP